MNKTLFSKPAPTRSLQITAENNKIPAFDRKIISVPAAYKDLQEDNKLDPSRPTGQLISNVSDTSDSPN